jgi:hypothetical protein
MLGIVVANMVRAIRAVSVERGHDPRAFALLPFGGAGPLHATDVAKSLGIRRCLVPFAPGILCAQGLIVSDLRETFVRTAVTSLDEKRRDEVRTRIGELKTQADAWFDAEHVERSNRSIDIVLDTRYVGQNFELAIGLGSADPLPGADEIKQRFFAEHERAYGFHNPADRIEIVNFRLIAVGKLRQPASRPGEPRQSGKAEPASRRKVWFEADKAEDTPVYDRATLMPGDMIAGPAVIEQLDSTTLLFSGRPSECRSLPQPDCRDLRMSIDPITLEIMSNGLKSIADETYIALMKSAYSTNIKERHDHSTAIIDPRGRLIVQAENSLAIHLGSMMGLMNTLLAKVPLSDVREGDIFISNDPYAAGGSHLPDVNMAMPVFADGKLVCFMCNIAHHADIGGITPGSMAGGTEIYQEGTRIPVIRLFREGELQTIFSICCCSTPAYPRNGAGITSRRSRPPGSAYGACRRRSRRAACLCSPPLSTTSSAAPGIACARR